MGFETENREPLPNVNRGETGENTLGEKEAPSYQINSERGGDVNDDKGYKIKSAVGAMAFVAAAAGMPADSEASNTDRIDNAVRINENIEERKVLHSGEVEIPGMGTLKVEILYVPYNAAEAGPQSKQTYYRVVINGEMQSIDKQRIMRSGQKSFTLDNGDVVSFPSGYARQNPDEKPLAPSYIKDGVEYQMIRN